MRFAYGGLGVELEFTTDLGQVDWQEVSDVIRRAPLGKKPRGPEALKKAFTNSFAALFVKDGARLVGLCRALCDGQFQAAVYDVVLLPEYQGRGLGREMLLRLCELLPVENIILYAAPGKEGFYHKCGFRLMLTGMARMKPSMAAPEAGYLEP